MKNVISAIVAVFVLSCATQPSMIGKSVRIVEQSWGAPTRSWQADAGRHVYVWKERRLGSTWLVTLTTGADGLVLDHEQARIERVAPGG